MIRRWALWGVAALAMLALPAGAIALGVFQVPGVTGAAQALGHDRWHQVRIEQHIIIRITPGDPAAPRDVPEPPPLAEKFREKRMPACVPVAAIAGVRPLTARRLLLFMRDRRLVGADLSQNCAARDFYLGFYVSPTGDGQICAARDTIHSRAGTTCLIAQLHELVPVRAAAARRTDSPGIP